MWKEDCTYFVWLDVKNETKKNNMSQSCQKRTFYCSYSR